MPSLLTHPMIQRKPPTLSVSTTKTRGAWSRMVIRSGKKCQRRDSNPQRHKDIRFWGGHVCQFRHAGKKSVRCYGTSRFDTDLLPIVGDPSSTNGPTARSENSRCLPSTQRLSAVSEKCYVQDSNLILSTEGATHSCEHLHHLTDGHSKMIVYLY